ncbi:MAG: recombinase family protein [Fusobacteriaceae bacterium]
MPTSNKCVIYCRVSSIKQSTEGHGLESQEERCQKKAQSLGLQVLEVYKESITGSTLAREQFQSMLSLCKKNAGLTIIIDDISRYSRDTIQGLETMKIIEKLNCRVICLNQVIDTTTPEGWFMLTIAISTGQLMRQQNARQVSQKMLSRVQQGFWCFNTPIGYNRGSMPTKNKDGSQIKQLLEGFAYNQDTISDFHRKLKIQGFNIVRLHNVKALLLNPIYAGYLQKEDWNIPLIKAQHEPIISLETHNKIVDKVSKMERPVNYNTRNDQIFYHRGFLACSECKSNLTYMVKNNGKGYIANYYACFNRKCINKGKNIRLDQIENKILEKLKLLRTDPRFFDLVRLMVTDILEQKRADQSNSTNQLQAELKGLNNQIEKLTDKILLVDSDILIKSLETRIQELSKQSKDLKVQIQESQAPSADKMDKIDFVLGLYKNLYSTYKKAEPDHKKVLLHLILDDKIIVDLKTKYSTCIFSSLISLIDDDTDDLKIGGLNKCNFPLIDSIQEKYSLVKNLSSN